LHRLGLTHPAIFADQPGAYLEVRLARELPSAIAS
jgi:hypothetical protein